jgi:hypothetical protein
MTRCLSVRPHFSCKMLLLASQCLSACLSACHNSIPVEQIVGFEVLTAASTKMAVFWIEAPKRWWNSSTRLHYATTQKTAIFGWTDFSWNFIFGSFAKVCRQIQTLVKSDKIKGHFTWTPTCFCPRKWLGRVSPLGESLASRATAWGIPGESSVMK